MPVRVLCVCMCVSVCFCVCFPQLVIAASPSSERLSVGVRAAVFFFRSGSSDVPAVQL